MFRTHNFQLRVRPILSCLIGTSTVILSSYQSNQTFGLQTATATATIQQSELAQQSESAATPLDSTVSDALTLITEESVRSTVSFLASDELEGRATLSPGFEKAADYVAQRFKKAGLKPVAEDSYFHSTMIDTTQAPSQGVTIQDSDGKEIKHLGLLSGGRSEFNGKLTVQTAGLRDDFSAAKFEGAILLQAQSDARGRRVLNSLVRASNLMQAAGAKVLILQVSPDNDLIESATSMQLAPNLADERLQFSIPVLLIPESTQLKEGSQITVNLPAQIRQQSAARNVVAVLPGSDPELSKQFVLFSAHLDHLPPGSTGEDRIYNGADDNASGVTAVLTLADAFGALKVAPKRSVVFMTFWGEERGLLGSRQFAKTPSIALDKIVGNINIEMIGRPEPGATGKIWVTGWEKSDLGPLMSQASQAVGVTIFEHPKFSSMLYGQSDNFSFAEKGVVAHSFSAGSLHADYHQPNDEWDRLDIPHMTLVIKGLFAGSMPLAQGEVTPAAGAKANQR